MILKLFHLCPSINGSANSIDPFWGVLPSEVRPTKIWFVLRLIFMFLRLVKLFLDCIYLIYLPIYMVWIIYNINEQKYCFECKMFYIEGRISFSNLEHISQHNLRSKKKDLEEFPSQPLTKKQHLLFNWNHIFPANYFVEDWLMPKTEENWRSKDTGTWELKQ